MSNKNPGPALADGMTLLTLPRFADERGSLQEVFRSSWIPGFDARQWNCVRSEAGVLRGMHIHLRHDEHYVVVAGRLMVGWRDVRPGSPTEGQSGLLILDSDEGIALRSPRGICHGLYCDRVSVLLIGTTSEWDLQHEVGCHWQDPALQIPWPFDGAILSARDAAQPALSTVLPRVDPWVTSIDQGDRPAHSIGSADE